MSPTKRQKDALRFIRGFQLAKGRTPGLRTISRGLGLASHSGILVLLAGLEERGLIARYPRRWLCEQRAIEVLTDIPIPRAPDGAPLYWVDAP